MNCLHCKDPLDTSGRYSTLKWCLDKSECRSAAEQARKENLRVAALKYRLTTKCKDRERTRYRIFMTKKHCDGCGEFVKINGRFCDKPGCQSMKKDIKINGWEYYDRQIMTGELIQEGAVY